MNKNTYALVPLLFSLLACSPEQPANGADEPGLPFFTDPTAAREAVEAMGMTDVVIGGYAWGACGEDDTTHTSFTATNPRGERVEGVVCCGLFWKNCTVRW